MARLMIALGCITLLVTLAIAGGQSSRPPAGTAHSGAAFRFNKVADGVYHAIGTGTLTVIGNSAVILNDDDVIIVDDHASPAAAWRRSILRLRESRIQRAGHNPTLGSLQRGSVDRLPVPQLRTRFRAADARDTQL